MCTLALHTRAACRRLSLERCPAATSTSTARLLQPAAPLTVQLETPPSIADSERRALDNARALGIASASLFVLSSPRPARACPRCATGQEVRREVWRDGFFDHAAMAVLPFLIIAAISLRLHAIGRQR
jgi:hypothetical protein